MSHFFDLLLCAGAIVFLSTLAAFCAGHCVYLLAVLVRELVRDCGRSPDRRNLGAIAAACVTVVPWCVLQGLSAWAFMLAVPDLVAYCVKL